MAESKKPAEAETYTAPDFAPSIFDAEVPATQPTFTAGLLYRFTSRKFLTAVVASAVIFGNFYFDLDLSVDEVLVTVAPLIAFIAAEGAKDIKEAKKG